MPCVGEVLYIGHSHKALADTNWRVLSVQHIPPIDDQNWCDAVAEIHVIKVDEFDPWAGEHLTQRR